ncbi:hypothetical protein PVMG_05919 [Plasmodium vivax Mauritania I]|uniref:Uncharacterized protein n=1 Tax=Plasmodium vivax Mauritania I TaxID=1035515 RepID=A0A0J9T3F7_PLAVI|nr:hypothetical protein PVMG_05919 [Plasmodium vivax Mauritania I]
MIVLKNYTIKKKVKFRFCIKILGFILLIWIHFCHNNVNFIKKQHKNNNRIKTEGRLNSNRLLGINDAKQAFTTDRLWRGMTETSENSKTYYNKFSKNEKKNISHDRVHENKSNNNANSVTFQKEDDSLKNKLVEKNSSDIGESHKRKKKEKCFLLEFIQVLDSAFEDIVFSPFDAIKNYRNNRSSNKKNLRKKAYKKIFLLLAPPILSILIAFIIVLKIAQNNVNEHIYIGLFSIGGFMILYILIKIIIYVCLVKRDKQCNK